MTGRSLVAPIGGAAPQPMTNDAVGQLALVVREQVRSAVAPFEQRVQALEMRLAAMAARTGWVPRMREPPFIVDGPGYPNDGELRDLSRAAWEKSPTAPEALRVSRLAIEVPLVYYLEARTCTNHELRTRARQAETELRSALWSSFGHRTPPKDPVEYAVGAWHWTRRRLRSGSPSEAVDQVDASSLLKVMRAAREASESADTGEAFSTFLAWIDEWHSAPREETNVEGFCAWALGGEATAKLAPTDLRWEPIEVLSLWRGTESRAL